MLQVSIPGGIAVLFGEGSSDDGDGRESRKPAPPPKPLTSTVDWEKSASSFGWAMTLSGSQTVLRGVAKERILHGLKQCEHHSSELGFGDTGAGGELRVLKSKVTNLSEEQLDRKKESGTFFFACVKRTFGLTWG